MPHPAGDIWPPALKLDDLARAIAEERGLRLGERYAWARYSFAAPAGDAVLKISPPEDDQADDEADALAFWEGNGAVCLLRHDRTRRALLIERAVPGYDASTLAEDAALAVALEVGRRLWRPIERGPFRRAHDAGSWFAPAFAGERVPLLAEVLTWARDAAMPLSIEIKRPIPALGRPPYPGFPRRVLELVREHRLTEVLFHSDDHASVLDIKRLASQFPTAIAHGGAMFIDPLAAVRAARADGLYTHWRYVTRGLVDLCHAAGVHVFGFGVGDDPTQLAQIYAMLENGTDFLSSAYPDRLRQVVTDWLASGSAGTTMSP